MNDDVSFFEADEYEDKYMEGAVFISREGPNYYLQPGQQQIYERIKIIHHYQTINAKKWART